MTNLQIKKIKSISISHYDYSSLSLADFIEILKVKANETGTDNYHNVRVDWERGYDDEPSTIELTYQRLETEDEAIAREQALAAQRKLQGEDQERRDYALFKQLKARFAE